MGVLQRKPQMVLGRKQKPAHMHTFDTQIRTSWCCNPRADATSKIPIVEMQHTKKERLALKLTDMIHRQNFNQRFQQRCIIYVPGTTSAHVLPASSKL